MATITLTADTNALRKWANEVIDRLWTDLSEADQQMWRDSVAKAKIDTALQQVCREMLRAWQPFDIFSIS